MSHFYPACFYLFVDKTFGIIWYDFFKKLDLADQRLHIFWSSSVSSVIIQWSLGGRPLVA